jgi:predicted adenylyl cyclase CyaB
MCGVISGSGYTNQMKEIEILYELRDSLPVAQSKLKDYHFEGREHTVDTYYTHPAHRQLQPGPENRLTACLRIREKSNKAYVAYKNDIFAGNTWLYSDEYETAVDDAQTIHQIFTKLNYQVLVVIDNTKTVFRKASTEIVLEEVVGLGNFIEIEYKLFAEEDPDQVKQRLRATINALGIHIGQELNAGKPELMLKKTKAN